MLPNQIPAADAEVVALASALVDVLKSAQNGGSALADAQAALPDLLTAAGTISNLGEDIKKAANQAYILWALGAAFEKQLP